MPRRGSHMIVVLVLWDFCSCWRFCACPFLQVLLVFGLFVEKQAKVSAVLSLCMCASSKDCLHDVGSTVGEDQRYYRDSCNRRR